MASKLSGIELTRYDDLFKTDAEREADRQERIQIIPAAEVFPYSRQPYTIDRPTPDLVRLMDSIEHIGIAEPLIVRPRDAGGYEIISGHRRDYCAKAVGLDTRPVIVRNYSDEEADILVVDYNINREDLLPSEKAKAYKLKLDAMKRQAGRPSKNSAQVGQNFQGRFSVELLAEQVNESRMQIQRYVRLNIIFVSLQKCRSAMAISMFPERRKSAPRSAPMKSTKSLQSLTQTTVSGLMQRQRENSRTLIISVLTPVCTQRKIRWSIFGQSTTATTAPLPVGCVPCP